MQQHARIEKQSRIASSTHVKAAKDDMNALRAELHLIETYERNAGISKRQLEPRKLCGTWLQPKLSKTTQLLYRLQDMTR